MILYRLLSFSYLPFLLTSTALAENTPQIEQSEINAMIEAGKVQKAFNTTFEVGDELFEHTFTAADGVGANVGNGQRFTLVPRADLTDEGAWASHTPQRFTGPNGQRCNICHSQPFGDGAGEVAMNNIRDPQLTGDVTKFINRQPPHMFGIGALQLLAEEMTQELLDIRENTLKKAIDTGEMQTVELITKGTHFGTLTTSPDGSVDLSKVMGIDDDLIVKPLEWKGLTHSVRAFVRDANHQELGMQAVEFVGKDIDGDGDSVINELSVGDITALAVYQAAQPRPVTKIELAQLGIIDPLSEEELAMIAQGETQFQSMECNSCHTMSMKLNNTVFSEPSQNANYRDITFPTGDNPLGHGLSHQIAVTFDLTKDLPDNVILQEDGTDIHLGNFIKDENGLGIINLFSDLKRHDMGPSLAEAVDEKGIKASVFLTQELWGVGSTPPYLHDGRATTMEEAIAFHGGEAAGARKAFQSSSQEEQAALIAYLNNLVLYKLEEEEES